MFRKQSHPNKLILRATSKANATLAGIPAGITARENEATPTRRKRGHTNNMTDEDIAVLFSLLYFSIIKIPYALTVRTRIKGDSVGKCGLSRG